MKVCLYIHRSGYESGGIRTYALAIINLLIKIKEVKNIFLLYSKNTSEELAPLLINKKIISLPIDFNLKRNKFPLFLSYLLIDIYYLLINYGLKFRWLKIFKRVSRLVNPYYRKIKNLPIDIFHVPVRFSPIYGLKIPLIITIHDIQEVTFPENFSSGERLHRAINSKKAINESDHIIVSFDHIKNDLLKYFDVKENKISICPPPFAEDWFLSDKFTPEETLNNKYELSKRFLLYPAATWKHKNHISLINAVAKLLEDGLDIQLVCTGNKTAYHQVIEEEIKKLNLEGKVKFPGIVPEEDLIGLYKAASLVVVPTLYEAGSGPLYEAMRYSSPVICSNVTSLPETMGNNNFIFDPNRIDGIVSLIKKMLTDEEFRQENLENSKKRMESLKAVDYSTNFTDVYKEVISAS